MKTDVKGLAAVCAASLVVMALMMVPGLLLQPRIVQAQANTYPICSPGGVSGCYNCLSNPSPPPANAGCDGTTSPPPGWSVGYCVNEGPRGSTCTSGSIVCGTYVNCSTGVVVGTCATLSICI